ncbi:glycosyltransferase [Chryseobacterium manosquense]|uniref:Glycosyltransferase n=2 Tax=Chryseobacterium manosquense TaxID=2754694 RepID=A0A7H1E0I8_9FLAO|nr:glycosyltransferase [Chryseobacterium manosquense]
MPNKIKLLFRHRSMEMGGVEKVMLSLLNNLDREKFDMTVLLNLNQGELRNEIPKHVRKIAVAKGKEDMSPQRLKQKAQLVMRRLALAYFRKNRNKEEAKLFNNEKFNVEIAMDWRDFEAVLSSPYHYSKKIGWFHSEIQVPKLQPVVPMILKSFPKFDHIVYCSQRTKDLMHKHYPNLNYPPESVIINAIPIEEIKKKSEENISDFTKSEVPVFIAVGRLHTRKGYHKLMDAHHKLLKDGFEHSVVIIGDGEELPNLLLQQKNLGIEETFILAGNKMNPYPYIKNADFFILPSESEAWPLVIAEALILKKPIIATKVGDIEMMIDDQKTGYLIDYKTEEIYAAMKEFITNKTLVEDIKKNLEPIENQFNNQKIFDAVEDIIINLAKK